MWEVFKDIQKTVRDAVIPPPDSQTQPPQLPEQVTQVMDTLTTGIVSVWSNINTTARRALGEVLKESSPTTAEPVPKLFRLLQEKQLDQQTDEQVLELLVDAVSSMALKSSDLCHEANFLLSLSLEEQIAHTNDFGHCYEIWQQTVHRRLIACQEVLAKRSSRESLLQEQRELRDSLDVQLNHIRESGTTLMASIAACAFALKQERYDTLRDISSNPRAQHNAPPPNGLAPPLDNTTTAAEPTQQAHAPVIPAPPQTTDCEVGPTNHLVRETQAAPVSEEDRLVAEAEAARMAEEERQAEEDRLVAEAEAARMAEEERQAEEDRLVAEAEAARMAEEERQTEEGRSREAGSPAPARSASFPRPVGVVGGIGGGGGVEKMAKGKGLELKCLNITPRRGAGVVPLSMMGVSGEREASRAKAEWERECGAALEALMRAETMERSKLSRTEQEGYIPMYEAMMMMSMNVGSVSGAAARGLSASPAARAWSSDDDADFEEVPVSGAPQAVASPAPAAPTMGGEGAGAGPGGRKLFGSHDRAKGKRSPPVEKAVSLGAPQRGRGGMMARKSSPPVERRGASWAGSQARPVPPPAQVAEKKDDDWDNDDW